MFSIKNVFILLFIASITATHCSSTSYLITDKNNDQKMTIKKGTTFKLKLKAQLGTGYSWVIKSKNPQISLIGKPETITLEENKTSAMDFQVFTIKAVEVGTTELVFHYIQPWEKKFTPASIFKVTLEIVEE